MPPSPATYEHFEIARRPDGSLHELGRGAMGVTYKAFDTRLGSYVALKVINVDAIKSEMGRVRFEREAKAAAHLNHPNVAAIFHRGQGGGTYFYAMQFIEGETFDAFVKRRGPLPAALALRLILQAAQGLSAASTRGLIHRDIKPANLMLVHPNAASSPAGEDAEPDDDDLLVKVIDFGLAKYLNKPGETNDVSLTGDRIVGTPYYMSPEQIDPVGKEIDARADIYSLGVTLWHLLSGNPPFRGTEFQVLNQHMNQSLPWEQLPATVPVVVHDLLERMMAKDPADRPASQRELIGLLKQQLRSLATGEAPDAGGAPGVTAAGQASWQEVVEQSAGLTLPPADFSLSEVMARRGSLTTDEVLGLLSLLAPVVDAKREQEGQGYDLTPAKISVRFDSPPADPGRLLAQRLDAWPPSQLEIATLAGPTTAAPDAHPARPLGALAYELLAGQPITEPYQPVAAVNARGNAMLRQVQEAADSFATAVRFAQAFRLALAGELRVPELPPQPTGPASSGWSSDTREYTPAALFRQPVKQTERRVSVPGVIGLVVLLGLAAAAGWWWYAGGSFAAVGPVEVAGGLKQPSPMPSSSVMAAAPAANPVAPGATEPALGSITTRAVRRYMPPPFFPPAAKAAHQHGKVQMDVDLDAAGNVTGVKVKESSGFPLLDESAMQAMRVWRFDPARTNGIAVPSRTEQSIEFKPLGP